MNRMRTISLYVQLARRLRWSSDSDLRVVSTTTEPPTRREPETVVVKVRLRVPDEAFDPAKHPEVVANIPLEMLSPAADAIEVEPEAVTT